MSTKKNDRDRAFDSEALEVASTSRFVDLLRSYDLVSESGADEVTRSSECRAWVSRGSDDEAHGLPGLNTSAQARADTYKADVTSLARFIVHATALSAYEDLPACPSEPLVVYRPTVLDAVANVAGDWCAEMRDRAAALRSLTGMSDERTGEVVSELLRILDASEGKSTVTLTCSAELRSLTGMSDEQDRPNQCAAEGCANGLEVEDDGKCDDCGKPADYIVDIGSDSLYVCDDCGVVGDTRVLSKRDPRASTR